MDLKEISTIRVDFIIDIMKSMHEDSRSWEEGREPSIYEHYEGHIDPETGILYDTDKWKGMDGEERSLYRIGDAEILESVFDDAVRYARKGKWIYDTLSEVREKEGQEECFELRVPAETPYGWIVEVTNLLSDGLLYVGYKVSPDSDEISHTWILDTWDYDYLYNSLRKYGLLTKSLEKERDEFIERASMLTGEQDWSFIYWLYPVYIERDGGITDGQIMADWEGYLSGGVYCPGE